MGFQNTSHSLPQKQNEGSRFRDCPHFFAGGLAPVVPKAPLVRELCYEAFAILHNGSTRTPVFVAQRLNRASILDADEKRTDKFFADARLPKAERAELEDVGASEWNCCWCQHVKAKVSNGPNSSMDSGRGSRSQRLCHSCRT